MADNGTSSISSSLSAINNLPTLPSMGSTGLSSIFKNTIDYVMAWEEQPLKRLQVQRDDLELRRDGYNEIQDKLEALQSSVRSLLSSSGYYKLGAYNRTAEVTPGTADATVATATATSAAVVGSYELSVTTRATAYVHASDAQASAVDALGKSGTLILGGDGTAVASVTTPANIATAASTSTVASGLTELGEDEYTIETRWLDGVVDGTKQFRVVDKDGEVVAVADKDASDDSTTTAWQTLESGDFDTKRGLTITFANVASGDVGNSAVIDYQSAGTSITVATSDSLADIAEKINDATQPDGRDIRASVVGTQLVLTGPTGVNNQINYTDNGVGLNLAQIQAGTNASFTVNSIAFSTESNTSLTNVIYGVTLNLAADAEGKTATIDVQQDNEAAQSAVEEFVTSFNEAITYIDEHSAVTQEDDGTYSRGALSTDTVFTELRSKLFYRTLEIYSNSGDFSVLSDIGISLDDDAEGGALRLAVVDSSKLEEAIESNYSDLTTLLDEVMDGLDTDLDNYTGASGYVTATASSMTTEWFDLSEDIQDEQIRLIDRREELETQYAQMQAQILEMQYTFQSWQGIYGSTMSLLG